MCMIYILISLLICFHVLYLNIRQIPLWLQHSFRHKSGSSVTRCCKFLFMKLCNAILERRSRTALFILQNEVHLNTKSVKLITCFISEIYFLVNLMRISILAPFGLLAKNDFVMIFAKYFSTHSKLHSEFSYLLESKCAMGDVLHESLTT